jgi:hypothetical protein
VCVCVCVGRGQREASAGGGRRRHVGRGAAAAAAATTAERESAASCCSVAPIERAPRRAPLIVQARRRPCPSGIYEASGAAVRRRGRSATEDAGAPVRLLRARCPRPQRRGGQAAIEGPTARARKAARAALRRRRRRHLRYAETPQKGEDQQLQPPAGASTDLCAAAAAAGLWAAQPTQAPPEISFRVSYMHSLVPL